MFQTLTTVEENTKSIQDQATKVSQLEKSLEEKLAQLKEYKEEAEKSKQALEASRQEFSEVNLSSLGLINCSVCRKCTSFRL